ncbi:MAG: GHKL domain-containing protein [Bacteroidales bacterium]|nr:GHKL domain-containing protein [Bacteroidales bacterium]
MMIKPNHKHFLLLFIVFFILAIASGSILKKFIYTKEDQGKIQRALMRKYALLDGIVTDMKTAGNLPVQATVEKNSLLILVYQKDSLVYWSGNTIPGRAMDTLLNDTSRFSFISNAWYIKRIYTWSDSTVIGLLKIKNEFPYHNEFLQNNFQQDLKIPFKTRISVTPVEGTAHLTDWDGQYLFSLAFDQALKYPGLIRYLPPLLYLVVLLLFLTLLDGLFQRVPKGSLKNFLFLFIVLIFIAGRTLQVRYLFPGAVYNLELFGPFLFARSLFMPSLGDVLLNSILLLFLIIRFRSDIHYGRLLLPAKKSRLYILVSLLITVLACYFAFSHYIFSSLILNSSINFETFKVTGLTVYTFIGLFIVALHLTGLLLLADHILALTTGKINIRILILIFTVVYAVLLLVLYLNDYPADVVSFACFFVFFIILCFIQHRKTIKYTYSTLLIFVLLFSIFSVYFISHHTELKEKNNMKVRAENLATEHDPVAEYLLEELNKRLVNDTTLAKYLFNLDYSLEEIFNHLQINYFIGFWNKYMLRFTDCMPFDILFLNTTVNPRQNCYEFFNTLIQERGVQLPGSNFYFIDTLNGRINYIGRIRYTVPEENQEITLFIELESRLISEELGYPKLLLEEKYPKAGMPEDYSYAKYYKDSLIAQSGSFQYSLTLDYYKNKGFATQGYDHMIYTIDKNNAIIISRSSPTLFKRLVSFSYIFVFYYFLVLFFIIFRYFSSRERVVVFNFKNKIQFSILSVLLLSLLLIGGGTVYFSIEQYRKKQHDILSEKIQSVYIEIDHKLAYVTNLTPGWSSENYHNLNQLLLKFSDVFYTDINLYDPTGNLLATSRPEIFERGLQGEKMNPVAYRKMAVEKQAEFVNHESIGELSYLSAYVPYLNAENKMLAYLNLPYFSRQDVLSKDISALTVGIINVYVLLILMTIAIAVFISEQITRPLRLIGQKFSEIELGRQYEEISYKGKDEIGNLVIEYNRMVRELERSVEMLAKSERESAWREMAKQIAHEIKNPLTPMRLSVQQLQRAWKDNQKDYDQHLKRVTRTLIEQIDNLSNIASEFSNFAKMPRAVTERVNLAERIKNTLDLFPETENISFSFSCTNDNICIMADKEQISRVFINLIKNAIQSIPENKAGKIKLKLESIDQKAVFTISDNGKGIPDELLDKMFTPNFTTKSSGMGMGLAIVKNVVETCNGTVTFDTDVRRGTTFRIEIPQCIDD